MSDFLALLQKISPVLVSLFVYLGLKIYAKKQHQKGQKDLIRRIRESNQKRQIAYLEKEAKRKQELENVLDALPDNWDSIARLRTESKIDLKATGENSDD